MTEEQTSQPTPAQSLGAYRIAVLGEIAFIFAVAILIIVAGTPWAGDNPLRGMAVVWVSNVVMLVLIWAALRYRGQSLAGIGLPIARISGKTAAFAVLKSVGVLLFAAISFSLGAVVAGAIAGAPQQADMSEYNYLQGNLPMLLLSLLGVYIVSSFGEEVVYRGYLINRLAAIGNNTKRAYWIAAVAGAIIFGLVHYSWGPVGIVQTTFMGLALSITYLLARRNLWINVLAHVYLDTLLLVPLYFAEA